MLFNSLADPFLQLCSCVIDWMSKDLKISNFIEFAMQLFAQVVLKIQTEVKVNAGIIIVIMNAFNGECARSFCREKLLK